MASAVVLGGRPHGRAHLRQHRGSAEDRVGAARVDDGAHADGLIDVGADAEAHAGGRRDRRRSRGRGLAGQELGERESATQDSAPAEQFAARDSFTAHGFSSRALSWKSGL